MSGKRLKRVLKTPKEKDHTVRDEVIKLYVYFEKLYQRTSNSSYNDIEKVDGLIYTLLESTKIKVFKVIRPLARFIYRNVSSAKNFKRNRENKKSDKTVLKKRW